MAMTHRNRALMSAGCTPSRLRSRTSIRSWDEPGAYLADRTPGSPPRASTSRPVSSARVSIPLSRAYPAALMAAFSASVEPVSGTSSLIPRSPSDTHL